jgi:hypothetical protein
MRLHFHLTYVDNNNERQVNLQSWFATQSQAQDAAALANATRREDEQGYMEIAECRAETCERRKSPWRGKRV